MVMSDETNRQVYKNTSDIANIKDDIKDIKDTCSKFDEVKSEVTKLMGSASTTLMLLKWVITPLIVILGALVGVKIALPDI